MDKWKKNLLINNFAVKYKKVKCLCTLVIQPNRHIAQYGLLQMKVYGYVALLQIPSW